MGTEKMIQPASKIIDCQFQVNLLQRKSSSLKLDKQKLDVHVH
jgi:hypothetical protein